MYQILIIGGGLQALSVARSLKKQKYNVVALIHENDLSIHSRHIDVLYTTKCNPLENDNYFNKILDILQKHKIDVVIPMSDATAECLSINKEKIEEFYSAKCAIPSHDIFKKANDKWGLISLCEEIGLPHPKTRDIEKDKLEEIATYVGFPALIKPNISVGARGITFVNSLEELRQKYAQVIKQYGNSALQEYIENGGAPYYNVMLYRNIFCTFSINWNTSG